MPAQSAPTYCKVSVTGPVVKLVYSLKDGRPRNEFNDPSALATMNAACGWQFMMNHAADRSPQNPPNLNLSTFFYYRTARYQWTIDDAAVRAAFVSGMKKLAIYLASRDLIDPVAVNTTKIFRDIVHKRSTHPLLSVGPHVYELSMVVNQGTAFQIGDEFKTEVQQAIDMMEATCEGRIASERAEMEEELRRAKDVRLYPITLEDYRDGYSTYMNGTNPVLAKRILYAPKIIVNGDDEYTIKSDFAKTLARPAVLTYMKDGHIYLLESNMSTMRMPHRMGGGYLCTGTIPVGRNMELADIKLLLTRVEASLDIINRASIASHDMLGYDISDVMDKHCVKKKNSDMIISDRAVSAESDGTIPDEGDVL